MMDLAFKVALSMSKSVETDTNLVQTQEVGDRIIRGSNNVNMNTNMKQDMETQIKLDVKQASEINTSMINDIAEYAKQQFSSGFSFNADSTNDVGLTATSRQDLFGSMGAFFSPVKSQADANVTDNQTMKVDVNKNIQNYYSNKLKNDFSVKDTQNAIKSLNVSLTQKIGKTEIVDSSHINADINMQQSSRQNFNEAFSQLSNAVTKTTASFLSDTNIQSETQVSSQMTSDTTVKTNASSKANIVDLFSGLTDMATACTGGDLSSLSSQNLSYICSSCSCSIIVCILLSQLLT